MGKYSSSQPLLSSAAATPAVLREAQVCQIVPNTAQGNMLKSCLVNKRSSKPKNNDPNQLWQKLDLDSEQKNEGIG